MIRISKNFLPVKGFESIVKLCYFCKSLQPVWLRFRIHFKFWIKNLGSSSDELCELKMGFRADYFQVDKVEESKTHLYS